MVGNIYLIIIKTSKEYIMSENYQKVLNSERFKKLIKKRWTFSFFMLAVLFVVYYGYIFMIALNKDFVTKKVGVYTNVGIIMGIGVIFAAWILTYVYVEEIKKEL
jgi:uncharacterized membrane protein (DUF485 family)